MAKTKAQKQRDYIERLNTKDRIAYLDRLRKAAKKVSFHLVDKLKAGLCGR